MWLKTIKMSNILRKPWGNIKGEWVTIAKNCKETVTGRLWAKPKSEFIFDP